VVSNRWEYLRGYIVIQVQGAGVERLINLALCRGIRLWDIARQPGDLVVMKTHPHSFRFLRPLVRQTSCRVRITHKGGIPFTIAHFRRRSTMVAGATLFVLMLYLATSFIWFVDVTAPEGLSLVKEEEIRERAARAGLRPGVWRNKVDVDHVKIQLEDQFPLLAWTGVEIHGTRARIQVVERVLIPPELDKRLPAHVVATRDGVVQEILVLMGEPVVTEGQTVQRGQVLISGAVSPQPPSVPKGTSPSQPTRYVRARGVVRARVWYEAVAEYPHSLVEEKPTGRKTSQWSIRLNYKEVILKKPRMSYQAYRVFEEFSYLPRWRNLPLTVELVKSTYHEVEMRTTEMGAAGAAEQAARVATERIMAELPEGAKVVDRQVQVVPSREGTTRVRVLVETLEDIGMVLPITPNR